MRGVYSGDSIVASKSPDSKMTGLSFILRSATHMRSLNPGYRAIFLSIYVCTHTCNPKPKA